jgi:rfaE bifunctional protein nucleotidyltransferase chain/domain/rfaE bifunctional protein kinase chain/domain
VRAIVVLGDTLLDRTITGAMERVTPECCPVVEETDTLDRPGGAALAAMAVAADGDTVTLVTALSSDPGGRQLRQMLWQAGVGVVDLGLDGPTPEKLRVRAGDHTVIRIDRSCSPVAPTGRWTADAARTVERADGVLVSDYGRGLAAAREIRRVLERRAPHVPVVWDPHPRGASPTAGADLLTPNIDEARSWLGRAQPFGSFEELVAASQELARTRGAKVALTMGERGAVLAETGRPPLVVPARSVLGDTCGAGDRFAARILHERAHGADAAHAVAAAVRAAAAFVATGRLDGGALPASDAVALAAELRRTDRRVVVAGGCFDLLHAGHVAMLEAARSLGDGLIVCLNSDRSVRALKGPGRPLVGQADRRRVLEALSCVDAVHVFDELTPCHALELLRPHLFCKGGDYSEADLPERTVLEAWGGQVALVPFVDGRSSSDLIQLAKVS